MRVIIGTLLLFTGCFVEGDCPDINCDDNVVEEVVFVHTEQPCVQWEVTLGGNDEYELSHPSGKGRHFIGTAPGGLDGWEPIGAHDTGIFYRRCLRVLPPEPEEEPPARPSRTRTRDHERYQDQDRGRETDLDPERDREDQ